jgi:hypothetical protein
MKFWDYPHANKNFRQKPVGRGETHAATSAGRKKAGFWRDKSGAKL